MSVAEVKERHMAATETVNSLKKRLKQKHLLLLYTDVAGYAPSQGKTRVSFGPTDLVCCRTLLGHTGKNCCCWIEAYYCNICKGLFNAS